jgi:hypothetical protein
VLFRIGQGVAHNRKSGKTATQESLNMSNSRLALFAAALTLTTSASLSQAQDALFINGDGNVGVGTNSPEDKLHTYGDGVQRIFFESSDGGPVQVRFRTDSENRRFLAVNNANQVKSQLIFLDDRINFTGQTAFGADLWLSVGPDGIVSQGPTCGSPCDGVFDPEVFEVPIIEAHAAQMWTQKYLPAIGPTTSDEPINMTEKIGGIIHELEVAHIYIEQLHERLKAQQALIAAQSERFQAMEARLRALEEQ